MSGAPDLLIVGAGPAGIGAANDCANFGLNALLLDENPAPGGRIWQALERRGARNREEQFALFAIGRLRDGKIDARFGASVWAIEPDGTVFFSHQGQAESVRPKAILLATGTTERPLPIPGWTLPGVMTVGAAQIALKTGGLVPAGRTWIAGQGPLILLYANQVLEAGGSIAGIIDLTRPFSRLRALRHLSVKALPDIAKGLEWKRRLRAVPWIRATRVQANGTDALRSVNFTTERGEQTEPADTLLLHDGVIPSLQVSRAIGLEHEWNEALQCWQPVVDEWGRSSLPHVLVAGDAAGIGGADAAYLSGRIAALGLIGRTEEARGLMARRAARLAVRPLLDMIYRPLSPRPDDATTICRCEDVSAAQIRAAGKAGCQGMNQLKAYTRCGMGPCQGRTCGSIAARVLAEARGVDPGEIEPLRTRFPVKPLPVGDLLGL